MKGWQGVFSGLALILWSASVLAAGCNPTPDEQNCFSYQWNVTTQLCVRSPKPNVCCNEVCETGEDYGNCALDCRLRSIDVHVLSPQQEEPVLPGIPITVVFRLESFGRTVLGATVRARDPNGPIEFFDDGAHNDGKKLDGTFGGTWIIENDFDSNQIQIDLNLKYPDPLSPLEQKSNIRFNVSRRLDAQTVFPNELNRGSTLRGQVRIQNGSRVFLSPLTGRWTNRGNLIASTLAQVDENATAFFSIPTSTIDPLGAYLLEIQGLDANQNYVDTNVEIRLVDPSPTMDIRWIGSPPSTVERLGFLELAADLQGSRPDLEEAQLTLIDPTNHRQDFLTLAKNKFSINYAIPLDTPLGPHAFIVEARAQSGGQSILQRREIEIDIRPAKINAVWIMPEKNSFGAGETLRVSLSAEYANGLATQGPQAILVVNQVKQPLRVSEEGLLEGDWTSDRDEEGTRIFLVQGLDRYGNPFTVQKSIRILPLDPTRRFLEDQSVALGIFFLLLVAAGSATVILRRQNRLEKRRKEIIETQVRLQQKYFEQNSLSRAEYEAAMENLSNEQKEIEKQLGRNAQ